MLRTVLWIVGSIVSVFLAVFTVIKVTKKVKNNRHKATPKKAWEQAIKDGKIIYIREEKK